MQDLPIHFVDARASVTCAIGNRVACAAKKVQASDDDHDVILILHRNIL